MDFEAHENADEEKSTKANMEGNVLKSDQILMGFIKERY